MGKITIGKRDLIWSYLGTFFRLGVNIVLLPLVLKFLTDEELGLWYVFGSISALVVLLDFGFAPSLARNISYVWCGAKELKKTDFIVVTDSETDYLYLKSVLSTCRYIYGLIAFIAFFLLLTLGSFYIVSISETSYLWSWIVYSFGVFLNIFFSYYATFLRGVGAVAENNIAAVFSRIVQISISLPLLLMGFGLMGVSVAYLLSGIALRSYSRHAFYKYEGLGKQLNGLIVKDQFSKSLNMFKIIWHNASRDGLVTLSNYLSTHANTLISSAVIGLSATGSYGISVQILNIISSLSSVPFNTNHPKMQGKSVSGDKEGSMKLFSSSIVLYTITFCFLILCLLVFRPVLVYLKPNFAMDTTMLLVLSAHLFIYNLYHLCCSYISTFNRIPYAKSFVIASFASVILSFVYAKYFNFGIWALIVSPICVSLAYNAWKWPTYVVYELLQTNFIVFLKSGYVGALQYIKKILNRII